MAEGAAGASVPRCTLIMVNRTGGQITIRNASFPTKQWESWRTDFDRVRQSLMHLGGKRVLHRAHQRSLQHREVGDGTAIVHRWLLDNYADSMLMGLRRILDRSRGSFSLVKLLEEIAQQHSLLTFDRYLKLLGEPGDDLDALFPKMLWSQFSADDRTLDRRRICDDIERLRREHQTVLEYIDTVVAHRQESADRKIREGLGKEIDWPDLDRLFDDVAELFIKYYGLVNPGVHVDFAPVLPAGYQRAFDLMMASDDG